MAGQLEGKVAIITGAARGQGAAEARRFAAEGAKVVLTDLSREGAAVAAGIGPSALFIEQDVGDEAGWSDVVSATLAAFGRIDILVNNAGIYIPRALPDTDAALMERHYRVNQLGVFLGMKAVIDAMTAAGGGSIVNISSQAGQAGHPGMFAYATTKWAVRGMTKVAAQDLARLKIRVNSVHPGLIDTPMLDENTEATLDAFKQATPLGRFGTVEEIADLVLFLASERSSFITGAEVAITGGIGL
jgi:3alpha(or 20beta)-hydroxysteroid dehydrogenase